MCDCWETNDQPATKNFRSYASEIFERCADQHFWFGVEQEYTLFSRDMWPLGFPHGGYPEPQGKYYCGVGTGCAFGRDIVEAHYRACLYAGVNISGVNLEVMPGQHEFQVGPCEGVSIGDHMYIARYILLRICEDFDVVVSFDPKPIKGDWNGAGAHINISNEAMRNDTDMKYILESIQRLERSHTEHMEVYGSGNEVRMTGKFETASFDRFTFGVANRGASVRIPRTTEIAGKGYIEDRRPASNIDPYVLPICITYW